MTRRQLRDDPTTSARGHVIAPVPKWFSGPGHERATSFGHGLAIIKPGALTGVDQSSNDTLRIGKLFSCEPSTDDESGPVERNHAGTFHSIGHGRDLGSDRVIEAGELLRAKWVLANAAAMRVGDWSDRLGDDIGKLSEPRPIGDDVPAIEAMRTRPDDVLARCLKIEPDRQTSGLEAKLGRTHEVAMPTARRCGHGEGLSKLGEHVSAPLLFVVVVVPWVEVEHVEPAPIGIATRPNADVRFRAGGEPFVDEHRVGGPHVRPTFTRIGNLRGRR